MWSSQNISTTLPTTNITVTVKLFGLIINWIVRRLDSSSPDIIVAID